MKLLREVEAVLLLLLTLFALMNIGDKGDFSLRMGPDRVVETNLVLFATDL